jgi:hypothetical protein
LRAQVEHGSTRSGGEYEQAQTSPSHGMTVMPSCYAHTLILSPPSTDSYSSGIDTAVAFELAPVSTSCLSSRFSASLSPSNICNERNLPKMNAAMLARSGSSWLQRRELMRLLLLLLHSSCHVTERPDLAPCDSRRTPPSKECYWIRNEAATTAMQANPTSTNLAATLQSKPPGTPCLALSFCSLT